MGEGLINIFLRLVGCVEFTMWCSSGMRFDAIDGCLDLASNQEA